MSEHKLHSDNKRVGGHFRVSHGNNQLWAHFSTSSCLLEEMHSFCKYANLYRKICAEEMSTFSLLAGVPCVVRATLTPSLALEAQCQLCECWKKRYFSIVLLCTINVILLTEDIAQPQQFHHHNI